MVRRHELRMERGPCLKAPKARSATDMRRSDQRDRGVQRTLGHANVATTSGYLNTRPDT